MVFGSNPAAFFVGKAETVTFLYVQEISISGQSAEQSKLRTMAREAARQGMANSKLRCLLTRNRSFD